MANPLLRAIIFGPFRIDNLKLWWKQCKIARRKKQHFRRFIRALKHSYRRNARDSFHALIKFCAPEIELDMMDPLERYFYEHAAKTLVQKRIDNVDGACQTIIEEYKKSKDGCE